MAKVWNISDHPGTKDVPRVLMIMGNSVNPGRSTRVDDSALVNAHKLNRLIEAGLVYVGDRPPRDYQVKKTPPKADLPAKASRAHGEKAKPVAAEPKKVKAVMPKPSKEKKAENGMVKLGESFKRGK